MFDDASIVAISVTIAAIFILIYGYLYAVEKKRFIGLWLISWTMTFLTYVSRSLLMAGQGRIIPLLINYTTTFLAVWLIYSGVMVFLSRKRSKWLDMAYILIGTGSLLLLLRDSSTTLHLIPTAVIMGLTYAVIGIHIFRSDLPRNSFKGFVGVVFFLWGSAAIMGPFFKTHPEVMGLGYLLIGLCGIMGAISLVALYFQQIREDLLQQKETIHRITFYDAVTRLYNRNYFEHHLRQIDTEDHLPLSIIYGDTNGLKLVNDTFGHHQGDAFLQRIARIFTSVCKQEDIVVRMSGDEFILILLNTDVHQATKIMEVIQQKCREDETSLIPLSIALGLAVKSQPGCSLEAVMKEAEERMYAQKLRESTDYHELVLTHLKRHNHRLHPELKTRGQWRSELAAQFGAALHLSDNELRALLDAVNLHEITGLSDTVSPEDTEEQSFEPSACAKSHAMTGYRITQAVHSLAHLAPVMLHHHEWWDGTGYPMGIKGEDIPYHSRILSILDVYDHAAQERPAQPPCVQQEALQRLHQLSGSRLDPSLTAQFINMLENTAAAVPG